MSRRQIIQRQEATRRTLERMLRGRVAAELRYTARAAAANYPYVDTVIAAHVLRMGTVIEEFYLVALRAGVRDIAVAVVKAGLEPEVKAAKKPSDNLGIAMRRWARLESAKKVVEIGKTTRDRIKLAIDAGLAKGLGEREVSQFILDRTGGAIASSRALTIARTESHGAAQAGSLMAAQDLGVVQTKEWVTVEDDRTRDAHIEADGQVVPVDDPFIVDGEEIAFPGDPSGSAENVINCRCVMVYGVQALQGAGTPSNSTEE